LTLEEIVKKQFGELTFQLLVQGAEIEKLKAEVKSLEQQRDQLMNEATEYVRAVNERPEAL
jgi:cell division protein FtsB